MKRYIFIITLFVIQTIKPNALIFDNHSGFQLKVKVDLKTFGLICKDHTFTLEGLDDKTLNIHWCRINNIQIEAITDNTLNSIKITPESKSDSYQIRINYNWKKHELIYDYFKIK